jgi:hypothetical protein
MSRADVGGAGFSREILWTGARHGRGARCLLICLMLLLTLPGCRGCFHLKTREEIAEEKKKAEEEERKRKEKKPDYQIAPDIRFRPGLPDKDPQRWGKGADAAEADADAEAGQQGKHDASWCKPGHWMCGMLSARANNFTVYGDLRTAVVHGQHQPAYFTGTPFHAQATRPISLEQEKLRVLEAMFYVPPGVQNPMIDCRITAHQGGGQIEMPAGVRLMAPYQYHFVVLARSPSRYNFLTDLVAVRMPGDLSEWRQSAYYRVVRLDGARPPPLPDFGLCWTTVAYLLWDDADPSALNSDQRQALLDWLHWGGQLILSGPDTVESLQTSFLKDYLPATSPGAAKLTDKDLSEINRHWTLPGHEPLGTAARGPWNSLRLEKQAEARAVPGTGSLVLERRVGRGRVVLAAFRLNESELRAWRSFDGFFNGAILGRPPRKFSATWQQVTWADQPGLQYDPCRVCQLRYFSRDAGRRLSLYDPNNPESFPQPQAPQADPQPPSDVGSWNDFSQPANLARKSLKTAALLEAPPRSFVLWVLAVYLVVLVPVNWLLFRLIGRVEWAWVAAPLVAVVCSLIVIHVARLDIGFARARFEVDLIEMQGQYPRAHLTRYLALYTSLTTDYTLHAQDRGAQFQPFSPLEPAEPGQPSKEVANQEERQLQYLYGNDVTMEGLRVRSNTTGLAHAEEMRDMGGPITLAHVKDGPDRVTNGTASKLQGTLVARRVGESSTEVAWVGTLDPGQSAPLAFQPVARGAGSQPGSDSPTAHGQDGRATADAAVWQRAWNRSTVSADSSTPGELCLGRLLRMAIGTEWAKEPPPPSPKEEENPGPSYPPPPQRFSRRGPLAPPDPSVEPGPRWKNVNLALEPGEVRLVAWSTGEYPGVEDWPRARQSHQAAVIVAHLSYQPLTLAQRDLNDRPPIDADATPAADPGADPAAP